VDRVKKVYNSARTNKKLIVLFDELFCGTNPADAFETSLDVITAFAKMPHVFTIVSTHLDQLPNQLSEQASVDYYQIGTHITPAGDIQFSYQLKPGVNKTRIGRKIAQNRGMLDN
jgi:DNA mismatch repair protein MutS